MPKEPICGNVKAIDDDLLLLRTEVVRGGEYRCVVTVITQTASDGIDVQRLFCGLVSH